jgi:hypothetical protein
MAINPKKLLQILSEEGYEISPNDFKKLKSSKYIQNLNVSAESVSEARNNISNKEKRSESFFNFMEIIHKIRQGKDEQTGEVRPRSLSFAEATKAVYGMSAMQYLKVTFGVSKGDSLVKIAGKTGMRDITLTEIQKLVTEYGRQDTNFATIQSTRDINNAYRFIIPEIILTAIDLGYKGGAKYVNWIATTEDVSTHKVTMPFIEEGDLMPQVIAEGGTIPMGSLKFGQKTVTLFKVGIGVKLTQELIEQSSINMLSLFLSLVGVRMSRGADVAAMKVLISGDQADLSESAPVIGVKDTAEGLQHYDMDLVMGQMAMLNQPADRLVSRLSLLIKDLNEGTPQRNRETVKQYAMSENVATDMWYLPASQYMFIDTEKCLVELNYGSMRVAQETEKSTETELVYVTKYIGFAVAKRDARVIVDASVAYSSNPFPAYMDIEQQLSNGFKS